MYSGRDWLGVLGEMKMFYIQTPSVEMSPAILNEEMDRIKNHVKFMPQYRWGNSSYRHMKYRLANWLMEGTLNDTSSWYNHLVNSLDLKRKK